LTSALFLNVCRTSTNEKASTSREDSYQSGCSDGATELVPDSAPKPAAAAAAAAVVVTLAVDLTLSHTPSSSSSKAHSSSQFASDSDSSSGGSDSDDDRSDDSDTETPLQVPIPPAAGEEAAAVEGVEGTDNNINSSQNKLDGIYRRSTDYSKVRFRWTPEMVSHFTPVVKCIFC
jgi:hypothetical protein